MMSDSFECEIIYRTKAARRHPPRLVQADVHLILNSLVKRKTLKPKAQRLLQQTSQITLVFVGVALSRRLNAKYRYKDYATDVLSFAPTMPNSLGELVFCVPVLKRQSQEHGLSYRQELRYMLIHGVLHLLGYDHEANDRRAKDMYRLQDQLFGSLYGDSNRIIRRKK